MTPRILQSPLQTGALLLSEENAHHLIRVLRCAVGEAVVVFDGTGREADAQITQALADACVVEVGPLREPQRESPIQTVVVQSLCLADKMDWVVQKCTELGVSRVIPLRAQRSQLRLDGDRAIKRQAHWQRVAQAAAAQSGRNRVPHVDAVSSLTDLTTIFSHQAQPKTGWLLDPFCALTLSSATLSQSVWIAIGPEAGWTDEEEQTFESAGFVGIRCGPRILRTETAAAAVLAGLAVRAGEF